MLAGLDRDGELTRWLREHRRDLQPGIVHGPPADFTVADILSAEYPSE
jgi:hypothetical protein